MEAHKQRLDCIDFAFYLSAVSPFMSPYNRGRKGGMSTAGGWVGERMAARTLKEEDDGGKERKNKNEAQVFR